MAKSSIRPKPRRSIVEGSGAGTKMPSIVVAPPSIKEMLPSEL